MALGNSELGTCPTGTHRGIAHGCGFVGCLDLRPWARAHRYKVRLEESYRLERSTHVKGCGRWYVEVVCRHGLIYPLGGTTLGVFVSSNRVAGRLARLPDVRLHQRGDREQVFRFPVERLDDVAAILRPKRQRTKGASPDQLRAMRERRKALAQSEHTRLKPAI